MEKWFKKDLEKIKGLEKTTFEQAILPHAYWVGEPETLPVMAPAEQMSEKKLVVDSFIQFSKEKIAESQGAKFVSESAQVSLKTTNKKHIDVPVYDVWKADCKNIFGEEAVKVFAEAVEHKIKVLFVSDEFQDSTLLKNPSWLERIFPRSVAELFQKMVTAMKLDATESVTIAIRPYGYSGSEENLKKNILEFVYLTKPTIIMTLGASSTNFLLEKQERLANVHGKFFPYSILDYKTQIVPMFHPNVLDTNQNMKKTAWLDMQQPMKLIGKA